MVILNDSFYGGNSTPFYSTTELNEDNRTHTAAFRIDDFIVLSFEDWTDEDYNDSQFNVWSNPIEAITNPDIPNLKPGSGDEDKKYSLEYKGIVAFEDCWPSKGDYDLNDVIVRYQSVLNFNSNNQVLSTEDTYELLWSGCHLQKWFRLPTEYRTQQYLNRNAGNLHNIQRARTGCRPFQSNRQCIPKRSQCNRRK